MTAEHRLPNLKIGHWPLVIGICLVFGYWSLVIPSSAAEVNKIIKIETKIQGQYSEVDVYTSQNIKPQVITLDSPNRVALAFANSRIDTPITLSGPSDLIRIIQAAQFDDTTVYVMIEPNEAVSYDFTSIIGRNKYVIEFAKAKPGAGRTIAPSAAEVTLKYESLGSEEMIATEEVAMPAVSEEAEAAEPEVSPEAEEMILPPTVEAAPPPVIQKKITPVVAKPVPAAKPGAKKVKKAEVKKKTMVTTEEISAIPLPLAGKVIVIDPGHGGKDPGYVGRSGIFEKKLTLKVALALKKMLTNAGAKVIMTRDKDVSLKKSAIVAIANNNRADMLVSIHFNAYASPKVSGVQSFYFNPNGKLFAKLVQKNLSKTIKKRDRGIKKEIYYTIHHTNMPSVLVEAGYLTNPKEERQILTPAYKELIASGIYKGIKEYVKITAKWQK